MIKCLRRRPGARNTSESPTPSLALPRKMLMGKEVLSRRIQVISDLVALCGLREPSRRGPKMDKIDRSQFEEPIDLDDLEDSSTNRSTDEAKSSDSSHTDEFAFPTDQYVFCTGDVTLCTFIRKRNSDPTHSGVM
jgi:hypothetical protein